jgi:hypothetical protein
MLPQIIINFIMNSLRSAVNNLQLNLANGVRIELVRTHMAAPSIPDFDNRQLRTPQLTEAHSINHVEPNENRQRVAKKKINVIKLTADFPFFNLVLQKL